MAISIDWGTKVISVPKADMAIEQAGPPEIRVLDVDDFRLDLKYLENSDLGMAADDTHSHATEATLSGVIYARKFEIINGYTVTFETGAYQIRCVGANHNLGDVFTNTTGPSLILGNAAGLQKVETGVSGLTPSESVQLSQAAADAAAIDARLPSDPADQSTINSGHAAIEAAIAALNDLDADGVWDHADAVTALSDLAFIKAIEGGRWEITGTEMIFYEDDNVTEAARFNLLDGDGVATSSPADARERTRV